MSTAANPFAFPTDAVLAQTRIPQGPSRLAVVVPADIRARLEIMANSADEWSDILADAARDSLRAAFENHVATLDPAVRGRCIEAARLGDEEAAAEVSRKIRYIEDQRRMVEERRRLDAAAIERSKPAPLTPEQIIGNAALGWLEATASEHWTGQFTSMHRDAVIASLEGRPLAWPFSPHPSDRPFLTAIRSALGVHEDATLDDDQMQTVRRVVDEAKAARAKATNIGPAPAVASGSGYVGRGR